VRFHANTDENQLAPDSASPGKDFQTEHTLERKIHPFPPSEEPPPYSVVASQEPFFKPQNPVPPIVTPFPRDENVPRHVTLEPHEPSYAEHERYLAILNGQTFSLLDLVCARSSGTWQSAVEAVCSSTFRPPPTAKSIVKNLVRVSSTRIFTDPAQSLLEIAVNAIDASRTSLIYKNVGKFGMGFFSILQWLIEQPDRYLTLSTAYTGLKHLYKYSVRIQHSKTIHELTVCITDFAVSPKNIDSKTGTEIKLYFADDEYLSKWQRKARYHQLERMRYVQGIEVWKDDYSRTLNEDIAAWNHGTNLTPKIKRDRKLPHVLVQDDPADLFIVADDGKGIPLDTLFGALLVPSLSSKGMHHTDKLPEFLNTEVYHEILSDDQEYYPGEPFGISVVVSGVMAFTPKEPEIAMIEMPSWTPVPIGRDNIIVATQEVADKLLDQLTILLDKAVKKEAWHRKIIFVRVENAIRNFATASNQAMITACVEQAIARAYVKYRSQIVLIKDMKLYNALYDILKDTRFIGGSAIDTDAIKARIPPGRILTNVFQNHSVVVLTTYKEGDAKNHIIGTGSLPCFVFVNSELTTDSLKQFAANNTSYDYALFPVLSADATKLALDHYNTFHQLVRTSLETAVTLHYQNETPGMIHDMWTKHQDKNMRLLQMLYDLVYFHHGRAFRLNILTRERFEADRTLIKGMDNPPDTCRFLVNICILPYGLYGQDAWYQLIDAAIQALVKSIPNPTKLNTGLRYGQGPPLIQILPIIWTPEHKANLEKTTRPTDERLFDLDINLSRYILFSDHVSTYTKNFPFMPMPPIGYGMLLLRGFTKMPPGRCFQTLATLSASTRAKFYMFHSVCTWYNSKIDQPFVVEQWTRMYINSFDCDFNVFTSFDIQGVYVEDVFSGRFLRDQDHIYLPAVQARSVYASFIFDRTSSLKPAPITLPVIPCDINHTHFTANQLIESVMKSTVDENTIRKIHMGPKTELQLIQIVVNAGNSRTNYILCVLQELLQNSMDAIRSTNETSTVVDSTVRITLGETSDTKEAVMSFRDSVGMGFDEIVKLMIPFYSEKSQSAVATGEMGTGFFNVYKEASTVYVRTRSYKGGSMYLLKSQPIRRDGQVVDIEHTLSSSPDLTGPEGTTITIVFDKTYHKNSGETIAIISSTVHYLASGLDVATVKVLIDYVDITTVNKYKHVKAIYNPATSGTQTHPSIEHEDYKLGFHEPKDGFSYGAVSLTFTGPHSVSWLMTNGVPFIPLAELNSILPDISPKLLKTIETRVVINLARGSYEAVQSRQSIRLQPGVAADIEKTILDAAWVACLYLRASNVESISSLMLDNVYGIEIDGFNSIGDPGQLLPTTKGKFNHRSDDIYFGGMGCRKLMRCYVPFGGDVDDKLDFTADHHSLHDWIHHVYNKTKDLLGNLDFLKFFYPSEFDYGKTLQPVIQEALKPKMTADTLLYEWSLTKVVGWWFYTKDLQTLKKKDDGKAAANAIDPQKVPADRKMCAFVDAFIRIYIAFGIDRNIPNFTSTMIHSLSVLTGAEGNFFRPADRHVQIGPDKTTMLQDLLRFIEYLCNSPDLKSAKISHATFLTVVANSTDQAGQFAYSEFMASQYASGAAIPHEIEHARRNAEKQLKDGDDKTESCDKNNAVHADILFSIPPDTKLKEMSFQDCINTSFNAIISHQMSKTTSAILPLHAGGVPDIVIRRGTFFYSALLAEWRKIMAME